MLLLLALLASANTAEAFDALRREEAARIGKEAPDDAALTASVQSAATDAQALMRFAARLVALGDRDPERAVRWLPKLPKQNQGNYIPRMRATEHLFRRWVQRDAQRAAAAALQFWR